jgi:hypothetical protein
MTKFLWAIEEQSHLDEKWFLLPNTVQVRRHHCEWDIKQLRVDYPLDKYRIVKYERVK